MRRRSRSPRPRAWRSSRRRSPLTEAFASLAGKTALVTGGSRGIGRAIALELARAGATVTLSYRSGKDEAEEVAREAGATALQADVSDPDEAKRLVEAAGELDILVNNAGVTRDGLIARMSDEDWQVVLDTNLNGVFHTCRAAARGMMKRRAGSVVNISSVVGLHGNPGQTNYSASKAGIIGFTKALARELGNRGVRANVVAPGYVDTRLTDVIAQEMKQLMLANTPLGRFGQPEDIAGAVRFLCSDEASFITGEVLLVDGGLGM
jgi:3-oxoacyl-[acyl-carrier protein] reductase